MPLSAEQRTERARLAANRRHHPDKPELTKDTTRRFKVAAAERYIRELVESAPPLQPEDIERLRALLPPAALVQDGGAPDAD